jgi:hypothetical protein
MCAGTAQFPEKMIPKFTLLASRGKDLPIHGDGLAVRRCAVCLAGLRVRALCHHACIMCLGRMCLPQHP